jgi:ferritin-like metal-binding protein YciE
MMELLQTKNHYDMERNMFVDKMLNSLSNATSKDEVRKNSLMHIDELRNQGQLYLNSYQKLLAELQKAKIETPIIEELMKAAPHVDGAVNEAGDVNAHQ